MTKKLTHTKSEIANAARIAIEHGVSVKLTRDGSLYVFPQPLQAIGLDDTDSSEGQSLRKWRESKDAGKAHGTP